MESVPNVEKMTWGANANTALAVGDWRIERRE